MPDLNRAKASGQGFGQPTNVNDSSQGAFHASPLWAASGRQSMQLFKPDNFRADWYGWASNQLSHAAIGAGTSTFAAMAWHHFCGEYPYQWFLLGMVMVTFTLAELAQRGNRFWDALEDLVFYAYGATVICYGFREQVAGDVGLDPAFGVILSVFGTFGLHQLFGIVVRKLQERAENEPANAP